MKTMKCKGQRYTGLSYLCAITLVLVILYSEKTSGQDILLINPSLEGPVRGSAVPSPWVTFEQSPDTQPEGCCGIAQLPSDGHTYVGLMASVGWSERMGQQLETPLRAGKTYTVSFDLQFPPKYFSMEICMANLAIWGANEMGEAGDTLWKSGAILNTDWKRFTAVFTPSKDYSYLVVGPYYLNSCNYIYAAALLDNFSAYVRQVPQLEVHAKNSCKDGNTGTAVVRVKNGQGPFKYRWKPGNYEDSTVSNLRKGNYEVTVSGANGTSTTTNVVIGENDLKAKISATEPVCNGLSNGSIFIKASGGVSPYHYSIDHGEHFQGKASFQQLPAGRYNILVKDAYGCTLNIDTLQLREPNPLVIEAAIVKNMSCSGLYAGELTLQVRGGMAPYTYSVPGYVSGQQDSIIRELREGSYSYDVTDDNNCIVSGQFGIIKEWRDCAVFIPTAFSPNGDGVNDVFRAVVHDNVSDFRLAVYGRWGNLVFETKNPDQGWNGTQLNRIMPDGAYIYVVTYTTGNGQAYKQTGSILLIH